MARDYTYDIMPEIKTRYAVYHFSDEVPTKEEVMPVFEAARYAPSCYNEQPWRFILGLGDEAHEKLAQTLMTGNAWAKKAPVLILVMAAKNFARNGKPNRFNQFDTGCAAGFLQLEAIRQGFTCHSMAGFDANLARSLFSVPEDVDILSMIALGRPADLNAMSPDELKREVPGERHPLAHSFFD